MAILKITAVPDFVQVKKAVAELESTPISIKVDSQEINAATEGLSKYAKGADIASTKTHLLGASLDKIILKMAAWQVLGDVISKTLGAFTDAVASLKAVDTEMVNVQKVTDYSSEQMRALEKTVYELASAYGRTAEEVTGLYTTFARAGYVNEQLDSMAELGTLLSNIGDVSEETSAKFLLAVDAAWKLNGSEKELMTIMDGLNEITNKNAVDMEALTSGITVAGSVFSEAGESVQTFSSLVGAGVAATQRSGSEISRALRTIVMNIRQIRGETEDGELVDGESIANASKALKEYAGINTMVNGQLRLSSDVLKELAGKWNNLDTVAQSAIAEALAGKRQANVLSALMGSWETVEKMMTDYADGIGSALRENEKYMDSWEAKSKKLKATWTEFIGHLVETDTIKGALDGVIKLVELLDSDVGHFVITVAALTTGVTVLGKGLTWLKGTEIIKNGKALVGIFADMAKGAGSFSDVLTLINPKILIVVAAVAALYGAYKLVANYVEKANRTLASFDEEIGGVNSQLESNKKRIEEINNMPWADRTSAILEEKAALEKENAELEKKLKLLDKEKTERAREIVKETVFTGEMVTVSHKGTTSGSMSTTFEKTVAGAKAYEFLTDQLNEYSAALEKNGEIADSVREQYDKDIAASARMVEALKQMQDAGDELTDEQLNLIAAYDSFTSASDKAQNAIKNHVSKLIEEARQSGATGKALYDLVAAQITAGNTQLNFSQQIAALRQLAAEAGYATEAYGKLLNEGRIFQESLAAWRSGVYDSMEEARAAITAKAWNRLTGTAPSGGWGGSSGGSSAGTWTGGSSSSGSTSSAKSRQNELDNAKKKAAQATIDAIRKQRDAETAAIDEKIAALKKQNEEEDRSKKLEELKLDILKKQDALLNARNERTVRQYNAATGQWEWVANPEKVKQAQEDLENAKKELREYEADVEREIAIAELEARKKAIEAAYQLKIDSWQKFIDQLNGDVETERALLAASLGDWDTYYQEMLKVYQGLLDAAEEYQKKMTAIQQKVPFAGGSTTSGKQDEETWTPISRPMTQAEKDKGEKKKKELALKKKSAEAGGHAQLAKDILSGKRDHAGNLKPNGMGGGSSFNTKRAQLFDSGGILKGMGGIKATEQDEMILPPDITARMTRLSRTGDVQQLFRSMRSVLFGGGIPYGQSMAGRSDNRRYSDHSGAEYHIGNVTLSQQQAECTTIAQVIHGLVEQSYHLKPYGN